jgi:hypothetical protein
MSICTGDRLVENRVKGFVTDEEFEKKVQGYNPGLSHPKVWVSLFSILQEWAVIAACFAIAR